MSKYTYDVVVRLDDGTVGVVHTFGVKDTGELIGRRETVCLKDENGMPTSVTGTVAEVLKEEIIKEYWR